MNKLTTGVLIFVLVILGLFLGYKVAIHDNNNISRTGNIITNSGDIYITGNEISGNTGEAQTISTGFSEQNISGFKAVGTEPFWGFDFSGGNMYLQDMNLGDIYITGIVGPSLSGLDLLRTGNNITMLIDLQACSDGMSENVYPGSINMNISGNISKGCIKDIMY